MALEGDFSSFTGDVDALFERYKELQVALNLNVEDSELLKTLENLQKNNDIEKSKRDLKEASGGEFSEEDFKVTLETDAKTVDTRYNDLQKKAQNVQDAINAYNKIQDDIENNENTLYTENDLDQAYNNITKAQQALKQAEIDYNTAQTQMFTD